jgi:hypothetical protein
LIGELSGNNHLNFDAPILANELVVASSNHITDKAVEMSGNDGGGNRGDGGGLVALGVVHA